MVAKKNRPPDLQKDANIFKAKQDYTGIGLHSLALV